MKRTDLHTPSNSTNGEMEAICQILEEALKYHCEDRSSRELHEGMDVLDEQAPQRLKLQTPIPNLTDVGYNRPHDGNEEQRQLNWQDKHSTDFLFNTDSKASIHIFKHPPNTIRKMVRAPHKFMLSRYLRLRRQAIENNIHIKFHHQKACHDLTDAEERQKPMAQLNNRCDTKAKQYADSDRTNAGKYIAGGDGITGLRFYIKHRGNTVQGDYYTVLSDNNRLQCFYRTTRHNNFQEKMNTSVDQNIVVQSDSMVVQCCQWLFRTAIFEQQKTDVTTLPCFEQP